MRLERSTYVKIALIVLLCLGFAGSSAAVAASFPEAARCLRPVA